MDPQTFDDWLELVNKVSALTNQDPYKLAPAKSQGYFSKTIISFPPFMGWSKLRNNCVII